VLDHLGKPDIANRGFDSWRRHFAALAEFPHVWCKLSGLVTEADWQAWTPDHLRPYIQTALDCFGPDRLMIGSDWPVCTVAGSYARTMQVMEDALAEYAPAERASVLGGTAQRLWNL
jgi:L-fuconolactonase